MKLFLTASNQKQSWVEELIEQLRHEGFDVWHQDQGSVGSDWQSSLEASEVIVFIITPQIKESAYVEHEIEYAIRLNKPILRVMLGKTRYPEHSANKANYLTIQPDKPLTVAVAQITNAITHLPEVSRKRAMKKHGHVAHRSDTKDFPKKRTALWGKWPILQRRANRSAYRSTRSAFEDRRIANVSQNVSSLELNPLGLGQLLPNEKIHYHPESIPTMPNMTTPTTPNEPSLDAFENTDALILKFIRLDQYGLVFGALSALLAILTTLILASILGQESLIGRWIALGGGAGMFILTLYLYLRQRRKLAQNIQTTLYEDNRVWFDQIN
ncbi:MAG: toll/interleukin-1 receptor domain-containing protein [Anaerolineae bacterium]|jgi:hypothetical protein|nr:toll/interleukin-1 receptor domain-containing protein [Anaerolineae bacterium]